MMVFLTEVAELVTATLVLAAAMPVFKKSNVFAICEQIRGGQA